MTRLAPALVLAGVVVVGAAGAASATGHHDKPATGHTPIMVCHNRTHNPHIVVVDDDSTKLHAHLAHRTQAQLMDLVEGYDGTAAQIRAACVRPSPVPTTTPTEVPSSTTTTTRPTSTTQTSVPSSSSSTSDVPEMTPTTKPAPPTAKPAKPVPATTQPGRTRPVTSPTRPTVVTSATPPDELAHTGFTATLALLGAGLLAAGVALNRKGARREH